MIISELRLVRGLFCGLPFCASLLAGRQLLYRLGRCSLFLAAYMAKVPESAIAAYVANQSGVAFVCFVVANVSLPGVFCRRAVVVANFLMTFHRLTNQSHQGRRADTWCPVCVSFPVSNTVRELLRLHLLHRRDPEQPVFALTKSVRTRLGDQRCGLEVEFVKPHMLGSRAVTNKRKAAVSFDGCLRPPFARGAHVVGS